MARGRTPNAVKRRIRNREQMAKALELKKAGATYQKIGDTLGVTRQRAHQIVDAALEELLDIAQHDAAKVRQLELERLDAMLLALYPNRHAPRVTDSILRIMERRAKLLGLDAPTLVAPTTPEGKALPQALNLGQLSVEQLEQLEEIVRAATPPALPPAAPEA